MSSLRGESGSVTPLRIDIRAETTADRKAVRDIVGRAFGQPDEADLVDLLRDTEESCLRLVAQVDGLPAGFVCFTPVTVGDVEFAGLAPVAVAPHLQGRGVGDALIRAGLERCPDFGWKGVFLVGDPAYYARFGFVLAAPLGFSYGDPYFDRALQAVELELGALRGLTGRVRFSAAFGQTGMG